MLRPNNGVCASRGTLLVLALFLQIGVGVSMVHFAMPLPLATMHNAVCCFFGHRDGDAAARATAGACARRATLAACRLCPITRPLAIVCRTPLGAIIWNSPKPKVSLLIVFTAIVGMVLASPGWVPLPALIFGTVGIAFASGSAAAFNHVLDQRIDREMMRTRRRPLPTGHLSQGYATAFAASLAVASMLILWLGVNGLTAILSFCSLIGYAMVYTMWLKRATPQKHRHRRCRRSRTAGTGLGSGHGRRRCACAIAFF